MNRNSESQLIGFCVEQRSRFDASAWERFSAVSRLELAATARFLAGVSWYGHQTALREVAGRLSPRSFAELAREVSFDPSRFGGRLKAHLEHAGRLLPA